jgi:adenosylhomocysteine nucleosidase
MLALVTALGTEAAFVKKRMHVGRTLREATWRTYIGTLHGHDVLLVNTGMGKRRAAAAVRSVLNHHSIDGLISFGFAGALVDDLDVADIVLPSMLHVVRNTAPSDVAVEALPVEERILAQTSKVLTNAGIRFRAGVLATAEQPVFSPDEKRELGSAYGADVVDMESFWIAQIASDNHVPFIALRAVSDTVQDAMLPFDRMLTDQGRWKWGQTAAFFLCRPWRLVVPVRLYINARRAGRKLAVSVSRLADELACGKV